MLKYRFKASKSSVSTNAIAVLVKICLYNRKLSIGIGICSIQYPIQSLVLVKIY
jgi:hypothetical protein